MAKFLNHISEGLIKLPSSVDIAINDFAVFLYLSACKDMIEEHAEDKAYTEGKKLLAKILAKRNLKVSDEDSLTIGKKLNTNSFKVKKIKILASDLPKSYSITGEEETEIKLSVWFKAPKKMTSLNAGGMYDVGLKQIMVSLDNYLYSTHEFKTIDGIKNVLETKLDKYIGTLKHEFTHAIQFEFLRHKDEDQVSSLYRAKATSKNIPKNTYNLSNVEFDPIIKTELSNFKSVLRHIKPLKGISITKIISYLTGSTNVPYIIERQSEFFLALKRFDSTRWKLAVKKFSAEVIKMKEEIDKDD